MWGGIAICLAYPCGDRARKGASGAQGGLDQYDLEDLRETFSGVVELGRPTLVDLSRISFLDVGCARELALISQLYGQPSDLVQPLLAGARERVVVRARVVADLRNERSGLLPGILIG